MILLIAYANLVCGLYLSTAIACLFVFCKQKTAYEMRISDWSSDVCSSDLPGARRPGPPRRAQRHRALPGIRRSRLSLRGQPAVQGMAAADPESRQLAGVHDGPQAAPGVPAASRFLARGARCAGRILGRALNRQRGV